MSVSNVQSQPDRGSFWQLRRITMMAMFIALSVVGALLKIPSPTGTVALDSAPGFLGAAFLGWREGALIAALGHLISAYTAGLPLTVPVHLLIALEMAIAAAIYAVLARRSNFIVTIVVVTVLNGVGMPLSFVPLFGSGFFYSMVVPLCVASCVNAVLAFACYGVLQKAGWGN